MESKAVGMIGLGIMGSAMSANLIRAGFKVLGYDVLPRRREELKKAGGSAARSYRQVAAGCDIVMTSLPSSEALLDTAAELAKSFTRQSNCHRNQHAADPRERRSAQTPRGARHDPARLHA